MSLYSSFNIWTSSRIVSVSRFLPINGPTFFPCFKKFLLESDHFEYYNVETLEIKFSPFSWAVMCCFVIFRCLFVWWIFCINFVKSVIFIECVHWRICSISLILASDLTDYLIFLEERKKKKERKREKEEGKEGEKEGGREEWRKKRRKENNETKKKRKVKNRNFLVLGLYWRIP